MSSCCLRGGVLCVGESVVVRSKQLREEVGSWGRRSDGGGRAGGGREENVYPAYKKDDDRAVGGLCSTSKYGM